MVGDAVTLAPLVADKLPAGDHAYVEAPVPLSVTDTLLHVVVPEPALTVGSGLTVTTAVAVLLQPRLLVPVTV